MARALTLELTTSQRQALCTTRDTHPKAYVRERAAAILKIADGYSGLFVAQHGLLRPRKQETVYLWYHRYTSAGIEGLLIQSGRGRKPAFFP
jgi:hypothetical protein